MPKIVWIAGGECLDTVLNFRGHLLGRVNLSPSGCSIFIKNKEKSNPFLNCVRTRIKTRPNDLRRRMIQRYTEPTLDVSLGHIPISQLVSGSGGRSQLTVPAHQRTMLASPASCLPDTCPKYGR